MVRRSGIRPRRRAHSGAPARRAVRGDHPRAQARGHRGRRRRPAGADRAHRGHGPDGARRRAAAAGGRSRAGDRAQEPAVRPRRRAAVHAAPGAQGAAARGAARARRRRPDVRRGRARARRPGGRRARFARSPSTRMCSAPTAAASTSSRGSAPRPTTRSTNSSISRSTTSGARRRRCRASSPGCARRKAEVKRDMEMARDEVRVMTVHGAKGLEAQIVILADTTTTRPEGAHPPRLLTMPIPARRPDAAALVWAGAQGRRRRRRWRTRARGARGGARRIPAAALCRDDARGRAAGRLRHARASNKIPEGCWYELVRDALDADCVREPADDGERRGAALSQGRGGGRAGERRNGAGDGNFTAALARS